MIDIDLSRMPVDDAHLKELGSFPNLRKLNLAFTNVKGDGLGSLKNLKHLKEISLSGTNVNGHALDSLKKFMALRKVFIWNVPQIDTKELAVFEKDTGKIKFETGYKNDTLVLKLTPPMVRNEEFVLTEPADLLLKHNINGVQIRYTLDGTIPDSINSPLYNSDVHITNNVVVKAKVFRKGWISSDVLTVPFFFSTAKPKEIGLLMAPNELFQAGGATSLFDKTLAGTVTTSGGWLGFKDKLLFEASMDFDKEIKAKTITLSTLLSSDAGVFPPESITIWYGKEKDKWKELPMMHPKPPAKKTADANLSFVFNMPDEEFRYLKIRAIPTHRVPVWVSKKPQTGWLFVDEIIVN